MTKAAYHDLVGQYLRIQSKKKLSRASMETLAIIAYKQPMTKSGIESIRGVNCDYAILKLVEKDLVEILGRAQTPGRPILYGTSDKFMDYFGIRDITDLPKLKEIIITENSIGMEAGLEKMHKEGLTEDFQFHPDPEPVNEEVDLSEVSLNIETSEEVNEDETIETESDELITESEVTIDTQKEEISEEVNAEVNEGQGTIEVVETQLESEEVIDSTPLEEGENDEELIEKKISDSIDDQAESEVTTLVFEEMDIPDIQKPLETFDLEDNTEEIRNEVKGEGVNSEEN